MNTVSLKLPTFWTSHPEVWFTQAEVQLNLRGIVAEETKYFHVITALDQETASHLIDLIGQPLDNNKYKALKDQLLDTFGLNR